jgi:hypothetical protein
MLCSSMFIVQYEIANRHKLSYGLLKTTACSFSQSRRGSMKNNKIVDAGVFFRQINIWNLALLAFVIITIILHILYATVRL